MQEFGGNIDENIDENIDVIYAKFSWPYKIASSIPYVYNGAMIHIVNA